MIEMVRGAQVNGNLVYVAEPVAAEPPAVVESAQ
jgi:hypothetical protein